MNKKNIMFVVPTLIGGGAEKTVANLSNYLIEYYNIYIVVINDTSKKYSFSGNLIVLGNNYNGKNKFKKIFSKLEQIKHLKKLKKQYNIKCSISFLFQADFLNVFSKCKEKVFISVRNKDSMIIKGKIFKFINKLNLRRADKVIVVAKKAGDDSIENFGTNPKKIVTIYNPCLTIDFSDNNTIDSDLFVNGCTIINVGRLNKQKGQWHLIRAFSKIVKLMPDARLLILGDGDLRDYLQKLINDYNLSKNIKLIGFVNNPYDYMRRADIFAFSSLFEGIANSVLEAISLGLPVVSTDCDSGPREILSPKTDYNLKVNDSIEYAEYGILVPTGDDIYYNVEDKLTIDENLLADAILKLLNNKDLRIKYKEKSIIRSKYFDIDNIIKEWVKIINEQIK